MLPCGMHTFRHGELEISYEVLDGPEDRTVVFLHGLLLSIEMMQPAALAFAGEFRPVLVELHGHGRSSRPLEPEAYSLASFSDELIALADHLRAKRFALFGTSLGADVALEAMLDHPDRIAGAVLEMPVLEKGARTARRMFTPVARALRSRRAPRTLSLVARAFPKSRVLPGFAESLAHLSRHPESGAAVIEGLLRDAERYRWGDIEGCPVPAMIIAHTLDPLHAFADAQALAERLPNGRLVRAYNILEMRVRPRRLLGLAKRFFDEAFEKPSKAHAGRGRARSAAPD